MARVLTVIAHPDDEAMFFVPALLKCRKQQAELFLVCMSTGNFEKLGETRKKELEKSCALLGIKDHLVIDSPLCVDGPDNEWDLAFIRQEVGKCITKWKITEILTFDKHGVSSHPNHIAVHNAVSSIKGVRVKCLETTSLLRKYIGPLDILLTLFLSLVGLFNGEVCLHPSSLYISFSCMCAHWSQLRWFRYLFIFFSRYAYINTLYTRDAS